MINENNHVTRIQLFEEFHVLIEYNVVIQYWESAPNEVFSEK